MSRIHWTFGALDRRSGDALDRGVFRPPLRSLSAGALHVRARLARPSSRVHHHQCAVRGVRRLVLSLAAPAAGGWLRRVLVWGWAAIEAANGIGHLLWSLWQGAYQPGVATAPLLLVLALSLGYQLGLRRMAGPP